MQILVYHIPSDTIFLLDEINEICTDGIIEVHYKMFDMNEDWLIIGDF